MAKIQLPEFPFAGRKVGEEISLVCNKNSCKSLYDWIKELYEFKIVYEVYRKELAK